VTKREIRAEMRERRKAVAPSERAAASAKICERLADKVQGLKSKVQSPRSKDRPCIAVYLASADEIDLSTFVRGCMACGVCVVAPRWNGAAYELAELGGDLVAGPHGILEPTSLQPSASEANVCAWIVPGLAFTKDGARLGYGGGWYDRLMAKSRADARKIGVGYRFQVVDSLPSEPHDIRLDEIVTD